MATPNEKLAESLAQLERLQRSGRRVFRSSELMRVHRERLQRNGYLKAIIKGWVLSSHPSVSPGDTTPWFASFWQFCAQYCSHRFGDQWHLSAEQSLLLHAESTVVPNQVVIYTPKGTNNTLELPFSTSLYDLAQRQMPDGVDLVLRDGLRLFNPEAALIKVPEAFFKRYPVEAQVAVSAVHDASDVLSGLLGGGHSAVGGRLAGALRRVGRHHVADEILGSMSAAGYDVRAVDPFSPRQRVGVVGRVAPIMARLQAMWTTMREPVVQAFAEVQRLPRDPGLYLRLLDGVYKSDAYHSLSIEGYRVTPELIERVRSETWDPDDHRADRQNRDALAARGYWQTFQLVRESIGEILAGGDAVRLVREAQRSWYRELFQPCVAAGLVSAAMLAGYRNNAVFLRGSRHVPPRWEAVRDAMPALFDLLAKEPESSVRAVLGHWLFGYVHPYPDGNGRVARFVMNAMLASGDYPWTVIRVEDRDGYLAALESASVGQDITPFARFVAERVRWSLEAASH